jgi:hypothetical protein
MVSEREITIMDHVIQVIRLYENNSDWLGYLDALKDEDRAEVYKECERLLNDGYKEE